MVGRLGTLSLSDNLSNIDVIRFPTTIAMNRESLEETQAAVKIIVL